VILGCIGKSPAYAPKSDVGFKSMAGVFKLINLTD